MINIAVLSFPGTNCELETVRAFKRAGMNAEVVLWNDPEMLSGSRNSDFDGYCLAGGFSYEDRSRSGVIAAQNPIMDIIRKEAENGKVVVGICNGAQILIESGLIPGYNNADLSAALAWNEMKKEGHVVDTGFRNSWCLLKNTAPRFRSAFNGFSELIKIPYAHGEGRFIFKDPEVLSALKQNGQVLFQYCDENGHVSSKFPITPNGSAEGIAALCNPAGNVMAIMPHPERDPRGNGGLIFNSIKKWIEEKMTASFQQLGEHTTKEDIQTFDNYNLEFFVRLVIVDNAERTVEQTLKSKGFQVTLKRFAYWGVKLPEGADKKESAVKIIQTGELANLNKEWLYVRINGQTFSADKQGNLTPTDLGLGHYLVTSDHENFVGDSKKEAIELHAGKLVDSLKYGVLWSIENCDEEAVYRIIRTKILYNPNSMAVMMD